MGEAMFAVEITGVCQMQVNYYIFFHTNIEGRIFRNLTDYSNILDYFYA